ncbi:hypothetical protein KCU78_g3459, partial [Aureobasidium melanogenum]
MITMDEETAKEIQGLQDQIASLLTRKIQREDVSMEDEVKHLKQRLTNSIKRCQDANLRSTQLSKKNEQLENENQLLERSTKDQARSIRTQDFEIDELEQENRALKAKLERLENHEAASKNAIAALREKLDLVLEAVSKIDDNPTPYRNAASAALDEETEEFVRDVLKQATSFVLRKREEEDEEVQAEIQELEDEIVHLKTRLTNSLQRCQETNMGKAEADQKTIETQAEKELLEKKAEEQADTIKSFETAVGTAEEENRNLKVELERLRKYEILWEETSTKFNTISYLHTSPPIMVTPADMIRELTLNNKLLVKKNEALKVENHNLKVTNDMLKNKAATDQAIMNAAVTIKNLEAYNQTLENENQHLREQLEHCAKKKEIDKKLDVLRKEVEAIDEELAKRMAEMDIMQELNEKMKLLKQIDAQEDGQKENESDSDDVFKEHTKEDSK